jgi:hypothetical protein
MAFAFSALRWACAGLIDFSLGILTYLGISKDEIEFEYDRARMWGAFLEVH